MSPAPSKAPNKARQKPRTAPKADRRQQLVQATIRSIAKRGIAGSTMADVASEAGLSQGIINLHFQSKDKLFVETLRFLADDYRQAWDKALAGAGPSPAEQLRALVQLDFTAGVADRRKLAVWFAFWGEVRSRPTYRRLCAKRDRDDQIVLRDLCHQIIAEGEYPNANAEHIATTISAISEGLWLDMLVSPNDLKRQHAGHIALSYLAAVFPAHFSHPTEPKASDGT